MQRRYSEPNTYIDTLPSIAHNSDELYDDVASLADPEVCYLEPKQLRHKTPSLSAWFCFQINFQFQFHFYMDSCHLAAFHLITSSSCVMQDAEESNLPDSEDNNPQEHNETCMQDIKESVGAEQDIENRVYLDLVPLRSFLHTSSGGKAPPAKEMSRHSPVPEEDQKDPSSQMKEVGSVVGTYLLYLEQVAFIFYLHDI